VLLLATAADKVTVTPWCDNSVRVQVQPDGLPVKPTLGALTNRALVEDCKPGLATEINHLGQPDVTNGNIVVTAGAGNEMTFVQADTKKTLFSIKYSFGNSSANTHGVSGYVSVSLTVTAGDLNEKIFGLGQGDWNQGSTGCGTPRNKQVVVPLERNGQTIGLHQRKFFVAIPFVYSTAGYGFLFNMPGGGTVTVGAAGTGGHDWSSLADTGLDFWVSAIPASTATTNAAPIYSQYADATGHAPMLRQDAMIFWQSRNRYMTSKIALEVANHYKELDLPVGVLVIDYKNQVHDGDFQPDPRCFPDLNELQSEVRAAINATTVFSFWPEVLKDSNEYGALKAEGCLINSDLGGLAIDPTTPKCRNYIWDNYVKPRYYDKGITAYWLDETDGEGTAGGDGVHGYDTTYGPAEAASNLWVNDWLALFTEPVRTIGTHEPLVLTRSVWAGGQRHGVVLWSSDIESTFEELTAQVPQGTHASLSGIPWWTTDVGGYGCGFSAPLNSTYMKELIVRWYQFGCFSPVFRTHGQRYGHDSGGLSKDDHCVHDTFSGGANEVWSYGADTQVILEKYVRLRATMLPYIQELATNVTKSGVPTMRPLWYEFPEDDGAYGINDQYMLGPKYLVAPVTIQNATSRKVYFPKGASWKHVFTGDVVVGGKEQTIAAPIEEFPVYTRV